MSSDAPPPPKAKPGSLRDRIAAFEKKPDTSAPAPPAPRPKPGGGAAKPAPVAKPAAPGGQMDLAAAVSLLASSSLASHLTVISAREARADDARRRLRPVPVAPMYTRAYYVDNVTCD